MAGFTIQIKFDVEQLNRVAETVSKGVGAVVGAAAGGGGRGMQIAGRAMGGEQGGMAAMKEGFGSIAKQLPGGKMMEGMAESFKKGGIVGIGMTAITGILGFVKEIVSSSKVFQGIAGSFFKIFGAMADLFLLPFLPLAMKGMQALLRHMPMIQEWGAKAAGWLEKVFAWFTSGNMWDDIEEWFKTDFVNAVVTAAKAVGKFAVDEGKEEGKDVLKWALPPIPFEGIIPYGKIGRGIKKGLDFIPDMPPILPSKQLGGVVPGGPGQGVPTMLHGGELVVPQDIVSQLSSTGGSINSGFFGGILNKTKDMAQAVKNYIVRFNQTDLGPGGALGEWTDEMVGNSILRNTWDSIKSFYSGIEDEARTTESVVASNIGKIVDDMQESFDPEDIMTPLKYAADLIAAGIEDIGGHTPKIVVEPPKIPDKYTIFPELIGFEVPTLIINAAEATNCMTAASECVKQFFAGGGGKGGLLGVIQNVAEQIQMGTGDQSFVVDVSAIYDLSQNLSDYPLSVQNQINKVANLTMAALAENDPSKKAVIMDDLQEALGVLNSQLEDIDAKTGKYISRYSMEYGRAADTMFAGLPSGSYMQIFEFGGFLGNLGERFIARKEQVRPKPKPKPPGQRPPVVIETEEEWFHEIDVPVDEDIAVTSTDAPTIPEQRAGPTGSAAGAIFDIATASVEAIKETNVSMDAIHNASDRFTASIGQVSAAVEKIAAATGGIAPTVGLTRSGFVSTTYAFDPDEFQYGGIVPGARGQPRMIMAHGGERIVPAGMGGRNMNANSIRNMEVTINSTGNVADVIEDLDRLAMMDDISFFNSVM